MENQTITISLERYEELIKKEVIYDQLTEKNSVDIYLSSKEANRYGC